jgi:hypothetical protein
MDNPYTTALNLDQQSLAYNRILGYVHQTSGANESQWNLWSYHQEWAYNYGFWFV